MNNPKNHVITLGEPEQYSSERQDIIVIPVHCSCGWSRRTMFATFHPYVVGHDHVWDALTCKR